MPQNDRNSRNRKHRRAYDQARDDRRGGQSTQRRSSAGAGSDLGYSGYAGYSSGGHPITNPNYDPDAPRPSRYTERTVNYGSYPDNSITFPTGGRSSQSGAQRPRSGQNGQRRTSGGNQRNRRPASGQNRNAQRRPQNAQSRSGQRMRPVQGQNARRDPVRREGRKKRKLTRAAIRRRRLMRRLTALVMLLCVIGAGVYLTVTMLFKISSIQVQTADGVVQEAGGYTSDQILQALDVHLEENIFSFDPGSKAAALEKVFPMLEDIRVERDYPGTVVVRVTRSPACLGHADLLRLADPLGRPEDLGKGFCPACRSAHSVRRRTGLCRARRTADLCGRAQGRQHPGQHPGQRRRQQCLRHC